ncbi:MAG: 3'-5' exonuclease [Chitinophagales bacterium]|nr:3'-5' exonuclease [Chitinophagales bacterium]
MEEFTTLYKITTLDFVAIDFETANELSISACEIGIALVSNYIVTETQSFLIRPPDLRFSPFNTRLHGIGADHVKEAPDFKDIWEKISDCFCGRLIIAHNAGFDLSVLRNLLLHYNIPFNPIHFTCSINVAKKVWKDYQRYGLKSLSKILGIELNHHSAASDARACAIIAATAFRENQVSIIEEIETKLNIYTGFISAEEYFPTRIKNMSSQVAEHYHLQH